MARVAGKTGRAGRGLAANKGVATARRAAAGGRATAARGWTKAKRREFLEHLAATMNVRGSARAVGVSEQSAYRLRARDEAFRAGWRAAIAEAYERLELEMLRSAIGEVEADEGGEIGAMGKGTRRTSAGRVGGAVGAVDSRLAMFLMKMHRETARGERAEPDDAGDAAAVGTALEAKLDAMCERMGLAEPDA